MDCNSENWRAGLKSSLVGGLPLKSRHKDRCLDNPVPPAQPSAFHQLPSLPRKLQSAVGQNPVLSNCVAEPLIAFNRYMTWP